VSKPAYRIVSHKSSEDCRRTVRYDRDYDYALVGPGGYVVSASSGPGGELKRLRDRLNEAYKLGYQAGLEFNKQFA